MVRKEIGVCKRKFPHTGINTLEVKQLIVSHINANSVTMASIDTLNMCTLIPTNLALQCSATLLRKYFNTELEVQEHIKRLLFEYLIMYSNSRIRIMYSRMG